MGSHGPAYCKRYAEEFRVFAPICQTNELDSCSEAEIGNTYDNLFHTLPGLFELDTRVYDGGLDLLQKSRDLADRRLAN